MQKPLVSVVMPTYNGTDYLSEAIQSVLLQDYSDFELVIVDDGSTDNTKEILDNISDNRVIIHYNQINMGISYSTNKAISLSRGKYIALMDDDDLSMPDRLSKQVGFMENNQNIDVLGGCAEVIDACGNHVSYCKTPRSNPKYIKAVLLFKCLDFRNGTTMIRKEFLDRSHLFYRDGYYGMQDYQFFIEASKIGNISSIDSFLIKKREYGENETDRQRLVNFIDRSRVYSNMRRISLENSGYYLNDSQIEVIDKAFPETNVETLSQEELQKLLDVFKFIFITAQKHNVDYLSELEQLLKRLYVEKLYKSDLLNTIFFTA